MQSQTPYYMKTIEKKCVGCEELFFADLKEHNRGNAKYCSRNCFDSFRPERPKKIDNCICAFCHTPFYRSLSKKSSSKSGLMFCRRSCKDSAQQLKSGFKEIHPTHYGSGRASYRTRAFANLPNSCNQCGYKKYPEILEVHHKDCDRTNNDISNLEILCPTCHDEKHFLTDTGKWRIQL